jgi:hypothetical protein
MERNLRLFEKTTNGLVSKGYMPCLTPVKHLLKRLFTRLPRYANLFMQLKIVKTFLTLWVEVDSIPLMQNFH